MPSGAFDFNISPEGGGGGGGLPSDNRTSHRLLVDHNNRRVRVGESFVLIVG